MKKSTLIPLAVLVLAAGAAAQGTAAKKTLELNQDERATYKSLDPKYRNWLDMVTYITVADERRIFLKLANDRDRDAFITIFFVYNIKIQ